MMSNLVFYRTICLRLIQLLGSLFLTVIMVVAPPSVTRAAAVTTAPIPIQIHGVTVWIRAYSLGGNPLPLPASNSWWKQYADANVTYSFAFGQPKNIWIVVKFRQLATHDQAVFYASGPKHPPLHIQRSRNTLSITNASPMVILTSKGGGWLVGGYTNYNLLEQVWPSHDLANAAKNPGPAYWEKVGGKGGVPQWEVSQAMGRQYETKSVHNFGQSIFGATERMPGAPPFSVQSGLIPSFPYFNIGYLPGDGVANGNWFTINPNPLFFNVLGFAFEQFSFVGFEYAGIYSINSHSPAPHVDFEAPFAFFGYEPGRLADVVIREENFPPGDLGGSPPTNIQRTLFRASWKTTNPQLWQYSLGLAGFYRPMHGIKIGPVKIDSAPVSSLMSLLTKKWPLVTFVQLGQGYPGSEGNYFYGGSGSASLWNWLGGLSSKPTPYLSHPYLMSQAILTNNSHRGLPVGYRGEYSDNYFRAPKLYLSPIDDLVHLMYAQGGIENLGHRLILRTESIGGSPYQNVWMLQRVKGRLSSYNWSGHTIASLYNLSPFLLSVSKSGITLKHPTQALRNIAIAPPQGKTAWNAFAKSASAYSVGRLASRLSSWISDFNGVAVTFPGATLNKLSFSTTHIRLWMKLAESSNASKVLGLSAKSLSKGYYLLQYSYRTAAWSISTATPPHIQLAQASWFPAHLYAANQPHIVLGNRGSIPWRGTVRVKAGHSILWSRQISITGNSTAVIPVRWVPHKLGSATLTLWVEGRILDRHRVAITTANRPFIFNISTNVLVQVIITMITSALLLSGSVLAWRRIMWNH